MKIGIDESYQVNNIISDDSTINVISSGDEDIDIINKSDLPENSKQYEIEVNHSVSEYPKRYVCYV